jgi:hypothetical protein
MKESDTRTAITITTSNEIFTKELRLRVSFFEKRRDIFLTTSYVGFNAEFGMFELIVITHTRVYCPSWV